MIFLTDSSQRVKRILKQPTHTETKSKFSVPKKSQFFKIIILQYDASANYVQNKSGVPFGSFLDVKIDKCDKQI